MVIYLAALCVCGDASVGSAGSRVHRQCRLCIVDVDGSTPRQEVLLIGL